MTRDSRAAPRSKSYLQATRRGLCTLAAVLCLASWPRPGVAATFTDVWWGGAAESGWGLNFVQAGNVMFGTFFVYDAATAPTWYTVTLLRSSDFGFWSGELFTTSGTYFGEPWDPAEVGYEQVGNVSFTPTSVSSGTLQYNVGSVNVTKSISRQTLRTIPLAGQYIGGLAVQYSNCDDSNNNFIGNLNATITLTQSDSNVVSLQFDVYESGTCKMTGTAQQNGLVYHVPSASYTCGGDANLNGLQRTAIGITGSWTAGINEGCQETVSFSAVAQP